MDSSSRSVRAGTAAAFKPTHLRAFLAVAENRSLSAAAKVLFLSQPAVTRIIRELEEELAVPLVERGARGVDLTSFGHVFLARATLLMAESQRTREEIEHAKDGGTGTVRFSAESMPAALILPAAFCRFRRQMPKVRVSCTDSVANSGSMAVRTGQLDFMLSELAPDSLQPDLAGELLFVATLAIGARSTHPRVRARSLTTLQVDEWVAWDRSFVASLYSPLGVSPPNQIVTAASLETTRRLVQHTDLLGVFPRFVLQNEMSAHGIRQVKVKDRIPGFSVGVVTRKAGRLTPAAECFLTHLRNVAQAIPAGS